MYYAYRLNFRFQIYRHIPGNDLGLRAKMKEYLCSDEGTKGLDDFSCSPFAFLDVFAMLDMADGLASHQREKQVPHKSDLPYPPRFEVCGGTGWITSEAVGSGLTSHGLRHCAGPAA